MFVAVIIGLSITVVALAPVGAVLLVGHLIARARARRRRRQQQRLTMVGGYRR
jgi:Flp pilus assembly protein TadB